ncbi:CPBP family intramembrane glutamic endopeptidase [uncultured Draconibacterium sp.]|uniref:CPBP family intramembrane glutamic endopeptidase n=1 Tax=uncultured Draconibacterium sp. TaxID=1573823 RepID=UPI0025D490EE|nr:CPBP family intramembrane glutamic endopeptidase [uncultured Draconibacterium sp.]
MKEYPNKYYPTILQGIHLVILYIFIQTIVDFPLAVIDYYKDTEYLYHPIKKIALGVGSVVFILIYGIKKAKAPVLHIFPIKLFNPLVIIPVVTFLWGAHNVLEDVNIWVEKMIPAPAWFWELFNRIFEGDYGFWGAFMKVAVIAPIVEELIFRGLIFNGFRKNYNGFVAVFMSALLFSLFHLNPWQMPATFVLGLLLGWLMLRTNNIFVAIIGHSINNAMVLLAVTYWQSIHEYSIYLLERDELLILSALVMALSIVLIYFTSIPWFRKHR